MAWLNWPNRITIARIALVAPLVICLLQLNQRGPMFRRFTLFLFVVMALTDGLDGYLARRLKEETPLGRFLDPVADKLLMTCAVVILAIHETAVPGFQLPSWVPVIAIGKDIATVLGFLLVYLAMGVAFIQPRIFGKLCTLLQSIMVAIVLAAPDLPASLQRLVPASWWLASGVAVIAVLDYLRTGNRFASKTHAARQKGTLHESSVRSD